MTPPRREPLPVCLAISTFRNDDAVQALLEAGDDEWKALAGVVIVDSLGTGRLPRLIKERGWSHVRYRSFDRNLGAAGNLAQRLLLGAEVGAEYVYAINHDGACRIEDISKLYAFARARIDLGAVYPLRRQTNKRDLYDVSGSSRLVRPFKGARQRPPSPFRVYWSSSNGALYSLAPVRGGLLPDVGLWHGWEDLEYGWRLHAAGYSQLVLPDVVVDDPYEYRSVGRRGLSVEVVDKPAWMSYYTVRNLLLAAIRTGQPSSVKLSVAIRLLGELGVTITLRDQKVRRVQFMASGLRDALLGREGKWRLPAEGEGAPPP